MNDNSEFYSSVTHFWEPDNGDQLLSDITTRISGPPTFNIETTMTVPNAYQKIKKDANGNWEVVGNDDWIFEYNGKKARLYVASTSQSIRRFYYSDLINLYKTRDVTVNVAAGRYIIDLESGSDIGISTSTGTISLKLNNEFMNKVVWEILGRMCHLLQDMSVPAHVHLDAHGNDDDGIRQDPYEKYFGALSWSASQVLNNIGGIFDIDNMADPIHFLMYTTAQMADHYAGAGPYSTAIDNNIGGNYSTDEYNYLNGLNLASFGEPTSFTSNIDAYRTNMDSKLLTQSIRATATLLYWFAKNCNLIEINVPSTQFPTLTSALDFAESGNTISVIGAASITNDVFLPSGVRLYLGANSSINFNGHSIYANNGAITVESGASGFRATLVEGDTPFATKAVCGTVQAAVTAATTDDNIYIEDGPFSESISISNKNSLRLRGGEITGNITVTYSDDLYIGETKCAGLYVNNSDEPEFDRVRVFGSGSGTGMSLFNVNVGYQTISNSNIVIYNFTRGLYSLSSVYSMENSPYPTWLMDLTDGVSAQYNSNIYLNDVNLCGITQYHLASYTGSYIEALGCQYDNATPAILQSGGTITYNYPSSCGAFKLGTNVASSNDEIGLIVNDDEFGKINNQLKRISKQIKAELKEGKSVDKDKYKDDFLNIGNQFMDFIKNNSGSKYKGTAVTTAIHCYKTIKDYEEMKEFIDEIKSDEEVGKYAERFMIDYYQKQGAYEKAIAVVDELLEKADDDLAITLLYAKGLIYGHDMDKPEEAIKCFTKIVKDYPEDGMADMALSQLSIFGVNELKEVADENETDKNLELSLTNSPNPFNPTTTINYQLPEAGFVTLKVFDMLGREVANLVNTKMEAGKYSVNFNASNLASGIYIYRITIQSFEGSKDFFTQSNKMLLLK